MASESRTTVIPPSGDIRTKMFTVTPVGQPIEPPYYVDVSTLGYSPLFEIYTPNSQGSRLNWKDFEHYKSVQAAPGEGGSTGVIDDNWGYYPEQYGFGNLEYFAAGYDQHLSGGVVLTPFGDGGRLDTDLPLLYDPELETGFIPSPDNLDVLTKSALASMLPIIKAELDLPNFILELKDFKRPVSKAVSTFRSTSFLNALKKLGPWPFKKGVTFNQLLRSAAGSYLNTQFNLLPLLSDIASLYKAMSRTERRINDFVTRSGRPQNKHFVYKWVEYEDSTDDERRVGCVMFPSLNRTGCFASRQVYYEPTEFHAQIQYNYNYTGYQVEHAQLLGHLDALGINLNPAIIWNAIPWSFAVDWLVGIGPYLDSLKTENMRPVINVRRYLWSIKRRRRIVVSKGTYIFGSGQLISTSQMPVVTQTAYRRSTALPSHSSIELSGLTPKEFSLGAALVIARRRT
jgi:hypothetical protein